MAIDFLVDGRSIFGGGGRRVILGGEEDIAPSVAVSLSECDPPVVTLAWESYQHVHPEFYYDECDPPVVTLAWESYQHVHPEFYYDECDPPVVTLAGETWDDAPLWAGIFPVYQQIRRMSHRPFRVEDIALAVFGDVRPDDWYIVIHSLCKSSGRLVEVQVGLFAVIPDRRGVTENVDCVQLKFL